MLTREIAQLAVGQSSTVAKDDRHGDFFAELLVGEGEGDRLGDGGVIEQDLVDFDWGNLLPTAVDHLLEPTGKPQITAWVQHALVAGPKPAVRERPRVRRRIALVTSGHTLAADHDFARLRNRQQVSVLVHYRDLGAGCGANRTGLEH